MSLGEGGCEMGLLIHKCLVAHTWRREDIDALDIAMEEVNLEWEDRSLPFVANPIIQRNAQINGSVTYTFAVDGSKEGWDASDLADALRARFLNACKTARYTDAVLLCMGGDESNLACDLHPWRGKSGGDMSG